MLHLTVTRQPESPDEAFALAAEHVLLAGCTTSLPCLSVRHHARVLRELDRWLLRERP